MQEGYLFEPHGGKGGWGRQREKGDPIHSNGGFISPGELHEEVILTNQP